MTRVTTCLVKDLSPLTINFKLTNTIIIIPTKCKSSAKLNRIDCSFSYDFYILTISKLSDQIQSVHTLDIFTSIHTHNQSEHYSCQTKLWSCSTLSGQTHERSNVPIAQLQYAHGIKSDNISWRVDKKNKTYVRDSVS